MRATIARAIRDAVHHQHGRGWKLGIAFTKQLTTGAFEKVVFVKAAREIGHVGSSMKDILLPLSSTPERVQVNQSAQLRRR
jgi:hypothetical protein